MMEPVHSQTRLTKASFLEELRRPVTIGLVLLAFLYGAWECISFLPLPLMYALLFGTLGLFGACLLYALIKWSWFGLGFAAGLAGAALTPRGLGLSLCIPLALASIVYARRRASRQVWFLAARATVILLLPTLGFYVGSYLYDARVRTGIARGQTLVDAIGRYEASVGTLPYSLQDLVPEWIQEVPRTGDWIEPKFTYITRDNVGLDSLDLPESFSISARYYGFKRPWWTQDRDSWSFLEREAIFYSPESPCDSWMAEGFRTIVDEHGWCYWID